MGPNISPHYISITFAPLHFKCNYICHNLSGFTAWRPFWKWHVWITIGFFPYTLVMCYWSLDLIFKAKQELESGKRKIQDGRQTAILTVTLLKINRLLPMAINNMHMKFQIAIPKQTWVTGRDGTGRTDGRTDGQTDRQGDSSISPPPTSLGGGYKKLSVV